jgi:CubicO group peptidase (beta-lactamase class C family)
MMFSLIIVSSKTGTASGKVCNRGHCNKMRSIICSIILFLSFPLSYGQESYVYSQPQKLNDGWPTTSLRTHNIDSTRVYRLFDQLNDADHKLHSVLIVQQGEIILEEYFDTYQASSLHDLRSVTKSIRSILLGIAIDKGFINTINDPISKYLKSHSAKKNLDTRKNNITIKHLVTMSTGLECNDWDPGSQGQEDRVYKKKDWIQYTLDLPMVHEPGTVSNYCSMGVLLLAEIISQASGMSIDTFAEKFLFTPLRISNVSWGHTSKREVIPSGKRLYMTPRDMAKIGQLIINNGKWNDQQVVSEDWISDSTTRHTSITGMDYGYLWWKVPFQFDTEVIESITATGNGGQYIFVFPEKNWVAVFTGGAYNSQEDKLPFAILKDVILPVFSEY